MTFGEILVKKNIVSSNTIFESRKEVGEIGISLTEALLKRGVSDIAITEAKSEAFGIPIKKIPETERVRFEVLKKIPETSARHYGFVPIGIKEGVIEIGVTEPDDIAAREALQFLSSKLNLPFKIFLISNADLKAVLEHYKSLGGEAVQILGELDSVIADAEVKPNKLKKEGFEGEEKITEDAPVTKMVSVIIRHAIDGHASDIHIEPLRDELKVRFRVDGVLYTSLMLPIKVHDSLVARVKVLTNMKLDERRKPQDGRFEAGVGGDRIDFRVSTFPTVFGEKVVIRILDSTKGLKKLEEIGMVGSNLKLVQEALTRTYGLILLTGPTGSGKTTTLYSMLNTLDREKFNVVSLEDPVEYRLSGVSQSQVRPEIKYTFANGLRSILRQDPDMIMVGEIRDNETANLAIQAALTGHLVFSTLHTNNAVGVIPRLIDMGIDPFLIPATLVLAIGQRLVRTLCSESRKELPIAGVVKETIEREIKEITQLVKQKIKMPKQIYQAEPSPVCPRGTRGRIGVFEILKMTPELEKIVLTNATDSVIIEEAKRQGMLTMREDGILKVLGGKIGLEELKEVI